MRLKSIIKPLNVISLGYSYLFSTITHRPRVWGMPVSVGIEITNHCNLKCPECSSGSEVMSRKRGFMDLELFRKVIIELSSYLYNINLYFQGEPMLHPQFFSFLENAKGTFVTVSTNGHFLTEENAQKLVNSGLYKLIVSLDGMDQETYSKYRKDGDLRKVIQGIKNVSEAKKKTRSSVNLEIQSLVNRYNESHIPLVKQFTHETGAKLRLKSMQVIDNEHIEQWLPGNEKFRRYKKENGNYFIKSRLRNNCLRLWLNPVITWDGKVVPCCFDKDADHVMGDLNKNSFRDIWYGEKYKAFRESVLSERKENEICRNCTSGLLSFAASL